MIMMVMLIMITIKIMNVEYIWLTSLNKMQINVSSAVAYDFNQLIYTVCALTGRLAAPREKNLPRPSLLRTYIAILLECYC